MAPTGPVNPANNIVVQPNITRQSLRSYQSLDDLSQIGEININVINRQSTSATMSQNEIVCSLNTLLLHQQYPSFSGEKGESVSDFISDLERCFSTVPSLTAAAKLNAVINNLRGDAKDTFRLLTPAEQSDYDSLVTAIKDRYTPTKTQLQARKANLYKTCQRPGQTVPEFVRLIQKESRGLQIDELDLVYIIINGLKPEFQNYVKLSKPTTIKEILDHPVAEDHFTPGLEFHALAIQETLKAGISEATTKAFQQVAVTQTQVDNDNVNFQHSRGQPTQRGRGRGQPWRQRQQQHQGPNGLRNTQQQPNQTQQCGRCGSGRCMGGGQCRAYGQQCRKCGNLDHFAHCCRAFPQ